VTVPENPCDLAVLSGESLLLFEPKFSLVLVTDCMARRLASMHTKLLQDKCQKNSRSHFVLFVAPIRRRGPCGTAVQVGR
jgi:hypothetical protein